MKMNKYGMSKKSLLQGGKLLDRVFGSETANYWLEPQKMKGDDWENQDIGWLFGYIFQRPGLDLKTRLLIVLAMMGVQLDTGSQRALRLLIKSAPRVGIEEKEIRELFIMIQPFAGAPKCRLALAMCKEIFAELRSKGKTPSV